MAESPHSNTTLSLPARLLLSLGPPSAILLTFYADRRAGLLSPLAFGPATLSYLHWRNLNARDPSRRAKLEPLLWTLVATSTVGITLVGLAQLGLMKLTLDLLFGADSPARAAFAEEAFRATTAGLAPEQLAYRAELARTWQNWVYNFVLTFVAAGLVEESLKYLPIAYARRQQQHSNAVERQTAYFDYAIAGALGFGITENIGFIYAASATTSDESPSILILTVIERLLLGASAHALTAGLMAVRAIRRDFCGEVPLGLVGVVGPSILLHGSWNLMAFGFSALEGNVGWVHPKEVRNTVGMLGGACGVVVGVGWWIGRDWEGVKRAEGKAKRS